MSSIFRNVTLQDVGKFALGNSAEISDIVTGNFRDLNKAEPPQLTYMWEILFTDPISGVDHSNLTYYAKATFIPTATSEVIRRYVAGRQYNYAGRDSSPNTFSVTFYDNQALEVYRFFERWRELTQFGENNAKVPPKKYMRNIELRLKDTTDSIITENFIMIDAYPVEISATQLTYSESGEITFDVIFSFSRKKLKGQL